MPKAFFFWQRRQYPDEAQDSQSTKLPPLHWLHGLFLAVLGLSHWSYSLAYHRPGRTQAETWHHRLFDILKEIFRQWECAGECIVGDAQLPSERDGYWDTDAVGVTIRQCCMMRSQTEKGGRKCLRPATLQDVFLL
jgi:hypothetical protein